MLPLPMKQPVIPLYGTSLAKSDIAASSSKVIGVFDISRGNEIRLKNLSKFYYILPYASNTPKPSA